MSCCGPMLQPHDISNHFQNLRESPLTERHTILNQPFASHRGTKKFKNDQNQNGSPSRYFEPFLPPGESLLNNMKP